MAFGTNHVNGLPVTMPIENMIVKIDPIIEGTKIMGRANLPFLDIKPSNAPPRNNRIVI